jgi:hypothetical protein
VPCHRKGSGMMWKLKSELKELVCGFGYWSFTLLKLTAQWKCVMECSNI